MWIDRCRPRTLPLAVTLKRFFAPEWVFIFGMTDGDYGTGVLAAASAALPSSAAGPVESAVASAPAGPSAPAAGAESAGTSAPA